MNRLGGGVGAVVLFVEDLARAGAFYRDIVDLPVAFEDADSIGLDLGTTMVLLLRRPAAVELLAGHGVGTADAAAPTFQLSVFVADVDARHAELTARGVRFLLDPVDRPWGKRTAHFQDPDGHLWELAQDIPG